MKELPRTRVSRVDAWRSVRRFCLECQGESASAVLACADGQCPLWPWRLPEAPADALATCMENLKQADTALTAQALSKEESESDVSKKTPASDRERDPRIRKALSRCALRAIRRHCLNCAGNRHEVRACAAREDCALWSLRFGVKPETYKAVRQRLAAPKKLSLL